MGRRRARPRRQPPLRRGQPQGHDRLDGVEKYVSGIAQFERTLGSQTQVDGVATLLKTHADLAEEIAKVSVSAARELMPTPTAVVIELSDGQG